MFNRARNPHFFTREQLRQQIKIFPDEFHQLCDFCVAATGNNTTLTHEARVYLFKYRLVHHTSYADLGVMFDVDEDTAKNSYEDILMYFFNFCSFMPNIWNDVNATEVEIENLLRSIKERQSPAIRVCINFSTSNGDIF